MRDAQFCSRSQIRGQNWQNSMCITIPKKIISVKKDKLIVETASGKKQEVSAIIKVKKDDWVLTQNGVIVSKITDKQAKEINKLIK